MRIGILSIVLSAVLATAAQPALATDFCVSPNVSCGGTNVATLQNALATSAASPGPDRIYLGAATYTAPVATGYAYNKPDPVEIIGAGQANTIITSPSGASDTVLAVFAGSGAVIRDLRVQIPPNAAQFIYGIRTDGLVSNVYVQEDVAAANYITGVALDGGTLESSQINLSDNHPGTGVLTDIPGGAIRDSLISARQAVGAGIDTTVERSRLTGSQYGLLVIDGKATIRSTIIDTTTGAGAVGIEAAGEPGQDTNVVVDGVTMDGLNSGTAIEATTGWNPDNKVDLSIDNTLIRGYATKLSALGSQQGPAHIDASYSDYASGASFANTYGTISEAHISNVGDAAFEQDNYVPLVSSPLIDAGDPGEPQGTDYRGNPLVTDGNHDGVARRDIGAFELAGPVPTAADPTPPAPAAEPGAGAAGDALPAAPATDTLAPVVSALHLNRARTRIGFRLSEAARVVVEVRRAHGRSVGKLVAAQGVGTHTLPISRRIRAALKPGRRYDALVTATDSAGNKSAPRRISFRVPR
jgi:hypothetical protein